MAYGSQHATVEAMTALTGLTHDIFVGRVLPNVRRESPTATLFQQAAQGNGPGEYRLEGQHMVFAADYRFATGGMATLGSLPDHVGLDPIQGRITPIRRYRRIAADSLVEKQASGPGAFQDFGTRLFDILWDSWKSMEIRHSIGSSSCLLGKVDARTSSTVFTIKDAYGNTSTNPLSNISEGSVIGWYDVSTSVVGGAGKVLSIVYSTRQITMVASWETESGTPAVVADDLVYFATTTDITADYFELERNAGPNGLGVIVDPAAAVSTVFNIVEATYPRHKPYRKASVTFDHLELTEHWLQLGQKRGFDVTPATDVLLTFPACVAQIARSLMGYQQQAYTGGDLKGGYTGVTVNGMPLVGDGFFYHNIAMTLWKEGLQRVDLGGPADFWTEDGNQWQRIGDFDGKEAFVAEYMQTFCTNRGANGALTGISVDVTSGDYTGIPDY
jgi:hypothetical protein